MSLVAIHSYSMYKPLSELLDEGLGDLVAMMLNHKFHPADFTPEQVIVYAGSNPDEIDEIIGMEEEGLQREKLLEELREMNHRNHEEAEDP